MQPLRLIALGLLVFRAAGSAAQTAQAEPPAAATAPLALYGTAQLTADPKVAALVDRLARQPRLQGRAAGFADLLGPAEVLAAELAALVPRAQLLRFKEHQSPIVRGSVIRQVVQVWPEELTALYPLLRDSGRLIVRQGCLGIPYPIAAFLLDELASRPDHPKAQELLRRAATDPSLGWIQRRAQEQVASAAR